MSKTIAACGNNCNACPRYMPKTDAELHKTAELWHRIGYRDEVVSNNAIRCFGCTVDNWCRYQIVDCVVGRNLTHCGQCADYPCAKIKNAFEQTMTFEPNCKLKCSCEEYEMIRCAFFEKEKNLNEK